MSRHVISRLEDLPPGTQRRLEVSGRAIVVFNVDGRLFALRDICPHRGARLSDGAVVGSMRATGPGCYAFDDGRRLVKCPWHGWEFDLETGQSWCDPEHERVRPYPVSIEAGAALEVAPTMSEPVPGPYVAETVSVSVDADYVVVEL
jgi:3-phenylpropionate/trans-cinnamate dioxygenase ferredoxin subunit